MLPVFTTAEERDRSSRSPLHRSSVSETLNAHTTFRVFHNSCVSKHIYTFKHTVIKRNVNLTSTK